MGLARARLIENGRASPRVDDRRGPCTRPRREGGRTEQRYVIDLDPALDQGTLTADLDARIQARRDETLEFAGQVGDAAAANCE